MFSFEETKTYNSTISQFCEEINVGRNNFILWLIDKGIFHEHKFPNTQFNEYFIPYDSPYSEYAGKSSYYITYEGKEYIKTLLTEDDKLKMKRSKNASQRHQSNYKYYRDYNPYPEYKITVNWDYSVI